MSLQVWLPMTKDLRQQGLSDVEATVGTTIAHTWENVGKIGNNSSKGHVIVNDPNLINTFNSTHFSICFWCNIAETTTAGSVAETYIISCGTSGTRTNLHIPIRVNGGAMAFCFYSDDYTFLNSVSDRIGTWMHVACIYNNRQQIVYINGKKIGERTANGDLNIAANQPLHIYSAHTLLNDLRIYDHALIESEVKEISRGLVLHYPLNDKYVESTVNLLPSNRQNFTVNGTNDAGDYSVVTSTGGSYTLSALIKRENRDDAWSTPRVFLMIKYTDGTSTTKGVNYNDIPKDDRFHFYEVTLTADTSKMVSSVGGWILDHSSPTTEKYVEVRNAQLENKDHATAYTPTLRSGENVIDISGFQNNGTVTGALSTSSDTVRYKASTYFDGTSKIQCDPLPATVQTVSFWVKYNGTPTSGQIVFADYGSKLAFGFYNNYIITWFLNTLITGNKVPCDTTFNNLFKTNEWNHFVVVKENDIIHTYCNGGLLTASSSDYWSYYTDQYFTIGNRPHGDRALVADVCDFRAYTTTLSITDIQELYEMGVSG